VSASEASMKPPGVGTQVARTVVEEQRREAVYAASECPPTSIPVTRVTNSATVIFSDNPGHGKFFLPLDSIFFRVIEVVITGDSNRCHPSPFEPNMKRLNVSFPIS
jgi:hypothetical protein